MIEVGRWTFSKQFVVAPSYNLHGHVFMYKHKSVGNEIETFFVGSESSPRKIWDGSAGQSISR
jgi:hypothetical protein